MRPTPVPSRWTPLALLRAVRDVAEYTAAGDDSTADKLTTRQFDANRSAAGHPDVPSSSSIIRRLQLPWPQVKVLAFADPDDQLRRLRVDQSDRGRKGISLEQVVLDMRIAARRLNTQALNRSSYKTAYRQSTGRKHEPLATLSQIDEVLHQHGLTWPDALKLAGLDLAGQAKHTGLSLAEAVPAFAAAFGAVPRNRKQLIDWFRAHRIPLARSGRSTWATIKLAIDELQDQRSAEQLPALPAAPADLELAAGVPDDSVPRQHIEKLESREAIVEALYRTMKYLDDGESLSQRSVKRISRDYGKQDQLLSYAPIEHLIKTNPGESFDKLRADAEQLWRQRHPSA